MSKTIEQHIKEQSDLAVFYAEDGAFRDALRVIRTLVSDIEELVTRNDALLLEELLRAK